MRFFRFIFQGGFVLSFSSNRSKNSFRRACGISTVGFAFFGLSSSSVGFCADRLAENTINLAAEWYKFAEEFNFEIKTDLDMQKKFSTYIDHILAPGKSKADAINKYYGSNPDEGKLRNIELELYRMFCPYQEYCPGRYAEEIVFCSEIAEVKCLHGELAPAIESALSYFRSDSFDSLNEQRSNKFCEDLKLLCDKTEGLVNSLSEKWKLGEKGTRVLKGFVTGYDSAEGMTDDFERELVEIDKGLKKNIDKEKLAKEKSRRENVDLFANEIRDRFVKPVVEVMNKRLKEARGTLTAFGANIKTTSEQEKKEGKVVEVPFLVQSNV